MTKTPVILIAKPGKSVASSDIRDFAFDSRRTMYKIHDIKTGTININTGEQTRYVDIAHGLSYVPKFWVYINDQLFPSNCRCYTTNSTIRVTIDLGFLYNRTTTLYNANQTAFENSTTEHEIIAGNYSGGNGSAVRFPNIYVNQGQTIVNANFEYKDVTTTSGSNIKFRIWGIDQDNCGGFSDYGDAGSRPRTDAVRTKDQSPNTGNFNFDDNWTALAQEIVNRSGWSNGNAMGFVFNDNGTDTNKVLVKWKTDWTTFLSDIQLAVTVDGGATSPLVNNVRVVVSKDKITS